MQSRRLKAAARSRSLALRVDRAAESRSALALIVLLSLATLCVVSTTSALSPDRATENRALASP